MAVMTFQFGLWAKRMLPQIPFITQISPTPPTLQLVGQYGLNILCKMHHWLSMVTAGSCYEVLLDLIITLDCIFIYLLHYY